MNLNDLRRIYFLGIGGIGMSALARYFMRRGVEVHGYDRTQTELTSQLEAEGMKVHYTDDLSMIPTDLDLVIRTPAVPASHGELQYLLQSGVPMMKRAEVLGMISKAMDSIAVAGTHGKTTTTSIITYLLRQGGVNCTAFLGGIASNFNSNYVEGDSNVVVVEADEFDRSFLQLYPKTLVVTALDPDHLDIYGSPDEMTATYNKFIHQVHDNGTLLYKFGLTLTPEDTLHDRITISHYGIEKGLYRAENLRVLDGFFVFDYEGPGISMKDLRFALPGRHNVENATAAIAVALKMGVSEASIRESLASFKGVKRRFEFIYRDSNVTYIDDYAHHPEELKAAIRAARDLYPGQHLTGVFQPHLFTRTRDFVEGFAEALDGLDEAILLDIYPAREEPIPGVTSAIIFDLMKNPNKTMIRKSELINYLSGRDIKVLLTLGAGDIDKEVASIKTLLNNKLA
jgi:UDP-N-acetylmuramate--alanine ligase